MMSDLSKVARRCTVVSVVFAPVFPGSAQVPCLRAPAWLSPSTRSGPERECCIITLVNKEQFLMRRKLKKPLMKVIVKTSGKSVHYEFKDVPPGITRYRCCRILTKTDI